MSFARQGFGAAVTIALAAAFVPAAAAQQATPEGDRAAVARQVRQMVEQLQQVREERRAAVAAHQSRVAELEQQIEQLQGQRPPIAAGVAADRGRIAKLEEQIAADQKKGDAAAAWIAEVAAAARPVAQAALPRIAPATDSGRSHAQLREAVESLGSSDPVGQAEGLQSLLRFYGEQWTTLRRVALANQALLFRDGQQMEHAWVLQIGSAVRVFVSEDEQTVGVWTGRPSAPWTTDVPDSVRRQIIELVGIARETRPPSLAPLPMLIEAENEGAPQ